MIQIGEIAYDLVWDASLSLEKIEPVSNRAVPSATAESTLELGMKGRRTSAENLALLKKVEELRTQLILLTQQSGGFSSNEVVELSQNLDVYLLAVQKQIMDA